MTIDLKTLSVIVSFVGLIVVGAMGYGSLNTEVEHLKEQVWSRSQSADRVGSDIMEMKANIATLLERTKP